MILADISLIAGIAPPPEERQQQSWKEAKVASVRDRIKAAWGQEEGLGGDGAGPSH